VTSQAEREKLAAMFAHPGVADAYQYRPPYPAETFDILERVVADWPADVLDLGAGEGAIARPLAARVDHVDALDVSAAMVEAGRRRPGGRRPNLRWIVAAAETADLGGPYALVTAGAALHWMAWGPTLARVRRAMTSRAVLAIVEHGHRDLPWRADMAGVIARHSRSPGYDPSFFLADALAAGGLLEITGRATTAPITFRQPLAGYVEQFHSTASLAREWMTAEESAAFDQAVTGIVARYATDGLLGMQVVADVTWGRIVAS
jgi:ubiquinone/menaquinone biosynthesis C-methylase UbiE